VSQWILTVESVDTFHYPQGMYIAESCLVLPRVSCKHFTMYHFKDYCEVFGGTLGPTKPLANVGKKDLKR
jgi:hypothetical protein